MGKLSIYKDEPKPDLTILRISGEFQGISALMAKQETMGALKERNSGTVLIDLAEVHYIDSAALGLLLELSQLAAKNHLSFGLIHVDGPVKKLIQATKLDKIINIRDDQK